MIKKYLERIGYNGSLILNRNLLDTLQTLHFYMVPYENLDILSGVPLSFEISDLYDKIVTRRRGGYCFELNGLYGWLLREIGFNVSDFMARFLLNEPQIPMRRHRVLVVDIDNERYLCDVGVGIEVPRKTIKLETGAVQSQNGINYKMEKEPFFGWVLFVEHKGEWQRLYSFTEEPQLNIDYVMPSFYCEKHPDSIFNKQSMLSIKTPTGRKTLDGNTFKIFDESHVKIIEAATEAEKNKYLYEFFGIRL